MSQRTRIAVALAMSGGLLFSTPLASSAQEADAGQGFFAEPAAGSSTEPAGGYFELDVTAGQTVTQSIALRNDSDAPMELHLAGVDAATAQTGGSSFGLDGDVPVETGTWLTLEQAVVTLDAGTSLTVPFRIDVPADARSGVHLAGISVLMPTAGAGTEVDAGGAASATVTVQSRRVIAVQLNLPGPSEPLLVITGVTPVARPDGLYLEMAVENRGRGLTQGEGDITLPDDDFAQAFAVGTFVPGTSIAYPIRWTDGSVDGDHLAHVEIRYGDQVAVWDGVVTVGREVREEQENRQVEAPTVAQPTGPADSTGFPVLLGVAGALGALALLGIGIVVGRRGREDEPVAT